MESLPDQDAWPSNCTWNPGKWVMLWGRGTRTETCEVVENNNRHTIHNQQVHDCLRLCPSWYSAVVTRGLRRAKRSETLPELENIGNSLAAPSSYSVSSFASIKHRLHAEASTSCFVSWS